MGASGPAIYKDGAEARLPDTLIQASQVGGYITGEHGRVTW